MDLVMNKIEEKEGRYITHTRKIDLWKLIPWLICKMLVVLIVSFCAAIGATFIVSTFWAAALLAYGPNFFFGFFVLFIIVLVWYDSL